MGRGPGEEARKMVWTQCLGLSFPSCKMEILPPAVTHLLHADQRIPESSRTSHLVTYLLRLQRKAWGGSRTAGRQDTDLVQVHSGMDPATRLGNFPLPPTPAFACGLLPSGIS